MLVCTAASPRPLCSQAAGKSYINSESNEIDGAFFTPDGSIPQWAPNGGSSLGPALSWPRQFLLNYINNRITGTIICPLSHAWTWAYGRHNHGTALFIEPWSGYYVLGGAFWTQVRACAVICYALFPH